MSAREIVELCVVLKLAALIVGPELNGTVHDTLALVCFRLRGAKRNGNGVLDGCAVDGGLDRALLIVERAIAAAIVGDEAGLTELTIRVDEAAGRAGHLAAEPELVHVVVDGRLDASAIVLERLVRRPRAH